MATSKSVATEIALDGAVQTASSAVKLVVAKSAITIQVPPKSVVVIMPLDPTNSKSGKAVLLANSHGYATTDVSIQGPLAWVSCNVGVSGITVPEKA